MMFKLIRTDQDSPSTTLLPGIHEFGRGVFLDCKDRRVARQHGQLTIGEDNNIILTALHKNPCFVTVKDSPGLIVMAKGMTKELKEGDEFGLLPDKHWYRLTKNEDNVECQNEPLQQSSTTCEESSGAVVKCLDSSSLLGDVEKEQPSTPDTPAEITDKDSPSLDTIMPPTPDVKCKHSGSSAKQTAPPTEALHYDGEPQLEMTSPPRKKGRYHSSLWNVALSRNAPEEQMDFDLESEDDDNEVFLPCYEEIQIEILPFSPADGEQPMEVEVDQSESSGVLTGQVDAAVVPVGAVVVPVGAVVVPVGAVVVPVGAVVQVGAGAVAQVAEAAVAQAELETQKGTQTGQGCVGVEGDCRDVSGSSGPRQRREYNTYSDDSESDSDFSVEYAVKEVLEDEEIGIALTEENDYTLFVAESGEPDDCDSFSWHDMTKFSARREAFTATAGPTRPLSDPYTAFTAIWDESIMKEICKETNRYFEQEIERDVRAEHSRTNYWKDTNIHEMYTYFAIVILMGIVQLPSIECYFSLDYLMHHPSFSHIMSKHRYRLLSRFLHFVNNEDLPTHSGDKKLFKIQSVIDHCNKKFSELYIPSQNIAIDESLTLWKGKLSWRQYIASKAAKFGIKTFEICESATGYLWSFTVYTGKNATSTLSSIVPRGANKPTEIVLSLIEPLLNKGYTIWMDNWFNSPFLARFLKNRKTDCAGTLRANRTDVPSELNDKEVEKGELFGLASVCCAVFAWLDRKRVSLISTFHTDRMVDVRRPGRSVVTKPEIVRDYNLFMGGIDKKDQMLSAYLVERKRSKKWYVKFFKRLLNVSVFNARILYEASTKTKISHLQFRLSVIRQILDRHLELARPKRPPPPSPQKQPAFTTPMNHTYVNDGHHFVNTTSKLCVVCYRQGRKKRVSLQCNQCGVPLCVDPCFVIFHTDSEFKTFFSAGTTRRRSKV